MILSNENEFHLSVSTIIKRFHISYSKVTAMENIKVILKDVLIYSKNSDIDRINIYM